METWKKLSLAGLGTAGTTLGLSLWLGKRSWENETRQRIGSLKRSVSPEISPNVTLESLDRLPEPVARYFRFALSGGQPMVRSARIGHRGEFNLGGGWVPFASAEYFSANPPAFVWDARMKMNPLMSVRVRDGYSAGQGSLVTKVLGLYTVTEVDARDERLAEGALMRYLAEAVWLPTALLPRDGLRWSPIDDFRALATLTDLGLTVSLEFTFGETGEVTEVFSPARYMESDGEYKLVPWAGRVWDYREHDRMTIPEQPEVEWQLLEGHPPYWKGRLTGAEYEFVG